jgi:hypothetical protein
LYVKRAGIYRENGRPEEALKDLKKKVELEPSNKDFIRDYDLVRSKMLKTK